jgi:catechol 2,3-dioxygenase-like lactoylglutathione lyase family enzyme
VAVTHLLIVRDVAHSRRFYADVLGARVLMEGPPAILRFYNSWLVLSMEGGPTDDKPDVVAVAPPDSRTLTSALNLRVADIRQRAGAHLQARQHRHVRVPLEARVDRVEGVELVDREVAAQGQHGVQGDAGMALGEDEAVALGPVRALRIDAPNASRLAPLRAPASRG